MLQLKELTNHKIRTLDSDELRVKKETLLHDKERIYRNELSVEYLDKQETMRKLQNKVNKINRELARRSQDAIALSIPQSARVGLPSLLRRSNLTSENELLRQELDEALAADALVRAERGTIGSAGTRKRKRRTRVRKKNRSSKRSRKKRSLRRKKKSCRIPTKWPGKHRK